jgi:hypothetical protein
MNVAGYKETFGAMEEICPISMEESEIKKELGEYDHQNIRKPTNRFLMHRKQNHIWLKMIEECGFQNISHFVVKTSWSVDNKQDKQYAKMIIDNFFANDMGLIWNIKNNCRERAVLEKSYRLMELLNERKNKRLVLFEKGIKIWDCIETDTNIFMGQK